MTGTIKQFAAYAMAVAAGCCTAGDAECAHGAASEAKLWEKSEWISAADAPVYEGKVQNGARAAEGVSWFVREHVNEGEVKSAKWTTTGLGVYELYVNGRRVGTDALKPGFTHVLKTRRSFAYDVTELFKTAKGETNVLAAEVSAGWWRDKIVNFTGKKSAFRAVLEVEHSDGSVKFYGTKAGEWAAGVGGNVTHGAIDDSWDAMERFMSRVAETKYRTENLPECGNYQWNDWLSLAKLESCPYKPEYGAFEKGPDGKRRPKADTLIYWNYLGGCHWLMDAQFMAKMAAATGRDAVQYEKMAEEAMSYLRGEFFAEPDGMIVPVLRGMQTPALFALTLGLVEGEAKEKTLVDLKASFAANGGTFHTGFLGTPLLLDTLTENGHDTLAYDLLLNHSFPGWLYSVDQGATTIWERWNSYTKDKGFGPVSMNSFNHYAYGAVLAWMYKSMAGIAPDPNAPGFKNIIMAPKPDRRMGFVKAAYKSAAGLIKSAWRYEGDQWIWDFSIPEGATADVTLPGETESKRYAAGTYHVVVSEVDRKDAA